MHNACNASYNVETPWYLLPLSRCPNSENKLIRATGQKNRPFFLPQNNEKGRICALLLGVGALESFQLQGCFAPLTLTRGSAPGPRWGLRPQTPVIGSRYRARRVPSFFHCSRWQPYCQCVLKFNLMSMCRQNCLAYLTANDIPILHYSSVMQKHHSNNELTRTTAKKQHR